MNTRLRKAIQAIALAFTLAAMVSACHKDKPDTATLRQSKDFRCLYDSIKSYSPQAEAMTDSLLKTAKDSQSFYGFMVLKGIWYLQANQLDAAKRCAHNVQRYVSRNPATPNFNTLAAIAKTIEAATDHLMRKNKPHTVQLYQEALCLIMQSDQKDLAPDIAANLADAYIFSNDIPSAAKWYRKALFLVDSLHLPNERNISLYMGLGQIYTTLEDYRSAQKYYELTERQFDKMEPNMQAYFLNNYGNYFYFKGDYPHALSTFLRLKQLLSRYQEEKKLSMYVCKINLADTYLNLGETDKAELYVNEAGKYMEKVGMTDGIFYANTIRMGIALKEKQYGRIDSILKHEPPMTGLDQNILNIRSRYLTDYYAHTGQYERAFKEQTTNRLRLDSTEHNKQNMRASEIMARFTEDTLRLHYELELRERDAVVSKSRATLWGLLSILVILVSTIVTIVFYQRKRKLQTDLDMFILRLAAIRQRISPHFVFNVLNAKIGNAPKDESDVLVNMAKLIRQNLELSGHTYVPLSEELVFVGRYIELQRTLLGDSLEFETHIPEDASLQAVVIPSMFIQILVENAVKHGLKAVSGTKRLAIDVTRDHLGTTISVTDNGPGFDIRRSNPDSTKTGLYVIRHTMAVMNKNNKPDGRMKLRIHNIEKPDGTIGGCRASLFVPDSMKMI